MVAISLQVLEHIEGYHPKRRDMGDGTVLPRRIVNPPMTETSTVSIVASDIGGATDKAPDHTILYHHPLDIRKRTMMIEGHLGKKQR